MRCRPRGNPAEGHHTDYRATPRGRRHEWYGLKRHVKAFLALPAPHALLRLALPLVPGVGRSGRLPVPGSITEVEGRALDRPFVMLDPGRCVVAKELYWGHGSRPGPQDNFAVELFARLARDADVMLDVGAYTGLFTLLSTAVNPRLHVHAFEIVPDVYALLVDNCARNGILDRATCHPCGIGPPGSTWVVPPSSGGSALPCFYSTRLTFSDGVPVDIRSLDSMTDWFPPESTVLMKVDVEGTEHDVFRHGQRFLSAFRPDILCEVLPEVGHPEELDALLSPHGYRYHLVREADVATAGPLRPHPRYRDWLFTVRGPEELPLPPR